LRLVKKGKVKDIYEVNDESLIFHFTNRISAFDIIMNETIPFKGKVLCDFAMFWFSKLNIENHFIKKIDKDKIMVKRLSMIPIECIVRGYMYGSLYSRYIEKDFSKIPEELLHYFKNKQYIVSSKLPFIVFDPSTKSEEHDSPISENQAFSNNLVKRSEFKQIKDLSLDLYKQMNEITEKSNFILADVKFEFGKNPITGNILLADSIGPDECRLWNIDNYKEGKLQDSYDKQILRDWLIKIGFTKVIKDFAKEGKKPNPPNLPNDIINKISNRYIEVYEKVTEMDFKKT
jgi:phosphoribosylaminoimidazole-succinocarboxamide synthase